ncbi:MAG TPA: PKD domain-containing protein, partial [Bacteroidetes bacterium]|nr:PKD domain-containing protein [Bacteroidota bacterium]
MTADSGDFALLMLPETSYRLQISAAGYQPEEDVFYTFGMKPGEMFRDTFYLSLPPVKVVAQVLDGVTSDPVINAKVRVLGKDLNYSTDSAGQFSFLASPYPEYQSRKMDCPVQEAPSYCFRFSDTGGMDSDSASFVYEWDFGDGTQLRGAEVEHCYTNPGIYWVELNLIDTISGYHFLTESSYELEVRAPRQVFILGPDSLSRGQRIVFDGSGSYLPNCEVDRYRWEVDGSGVGFGPKLEYAFREVGLHKIRLQVNGEGRESPRTCGACVTKLVWVLEPGWPVQREDSLREAWSELPPATVGTDIECTPQLSESHCFRFEDIGGAEGDTIPFVYEWDLGDGTRRRGKVVEHCYAHAGNYRVRLHIIDPYLRKSTVLQTDYMLEVKDLNQVFVESWDTIRTGQPFLFDAYQSEVPGCKINSVFWDYGDGESGSGPETKHIYTRAGTYRVRLVLAGRSESGQQCEVCSYKEVVVQDDFRGKGNSKLVSDDNIIENSILDPEKVYFLELSKPGYKTKVVPYLVVDSVGVLLDSILMEPELDEVVVEGMVKSENGELLEGVTLRLLNLAGEELQKVTAKGGAFTLGLEAEKSYFLMAGKEGYLSRRKEIGPFGKLAGALSPISFDLEPVIIGKSMVLKHIYYDFDKYNLREKSEKALEKVLRFLQENPGIRVELGSHTDARGGDDYNLWLSQKRAEAATQFLIARGLDKT